jgi:hypothetical protein
VSTLNIKSIKNTFHGLEIEITAGELGSMSENLLDKILMEQGLESVLKIELIDLNTGKVLAHE